MKERMREQYLSPKTAQRRTEETKKGAKEMMMRTEDEERVAILMTRLENGGAYLLLGKFMRYSLLCTGAFSQILTFDTIPFILYNHLTGQGLPNGPNVPDRHLQTRTWGSPGHHIAPIRRQRRANIDSQLWTLPSISLLALHIALLQCSLNRLTCLFSWSQLKPSM